MCLGYTWAVNYPVLELHRIAVSHYQYQTYSNSVCQCLGLKALTHYKDFHKDISKKIVGKIVVHI